MAEPPGGWVLQLSRALPAPPDRVCAMLTEAGELAKWWGPAGDGCDEIELDLRVGGHYRFTMAPPDGEPFHLSGEFREVNPPNRLAYSFRWDEPDPDDRETLVTLTLEPVGDFTMLSLTQGEFAAETRLALHHDGWRESLAKLDVLLSGASAQSR